MSKTGERRKYTVTPEARAQRRAAARAPRKRGPAAAAQSRGAAWKTGEHAATALAQAFHPCKRSICPMTDPAEKGNCSVKREADSRGLGVDRCPLPLVVNAELRETYVKAIRTGEFEGLSEFVGTLLAGMGETAAQELGRVMTEGLSVEFDIFGPDGATATGVKANPRAEPLLKMLEMLGATASQQAITPKAAGERKRDEGVGGLLEIYKRRSALAGASGEAG